MGRGRKTYPPEFRARQVEMARAGRSAESLSRDFEPTARTIRNGVKQADLDEGRRSDGLTTAEREELQRLGRENLRLSGGARDHGKGRHLVRPEKGRVEAQAAFEFVTANQGDHPVWTICRVVGTAGSARDFHPDLPQ